MSLVKARPPFTPTADHWRRPSTPMPNELTLVGVLASAGRPTTPACSIAYCSGFCVMLGSDSIILAFIAPSTDELSVWIRPVEAPTSTTSPTVLIFSSDRDADGLRRLDRDAGLLERREAGERDRDGVGARPAGTAR